MLVQFKKKKGAGVGGQRMEGGLTHSLSVAGAQQQLNNDGHWKDIPGSCFTEILKPLTCEFFISVSPFALVVRFLHVNQLVKRARTPYRHFLLSLLGPVP